MNRNEAKGLLIRHCEKYELHCDAVFQFGCARTKAKDKYRFNTAHITRKDSHCFAIMYFPHEDIYIAWNLWEGGRGTTNFSIQKRKVNIAPGQIFKSTELVGHNGSDRTRTVYAFQPECLEEFVRRYVARTKART